MCSMPLECVDVPDQDGAGWPEEDGLQDGSDRAKKQKGSVRDEGPACQACRKKKAKCSREQPCSHCEKNSLECVYDDRRVKPGIKAGAIDSLAQRVSTLESMFLGQGILWQQVWRCLDAISDQNASDSGCSPSGPASHNASKQLVEYTQQLKDTLGSLGRDGRASVSEAVDAPRPNKRPRIDDDAGGWRSPMSPRPCNPEPNANDGQLPADDIVDDMIEIYFSRIHPWIPMLHVRQFRQRMRIPADRDKLKTILYAISSVCIRFCDDPRLGSSDMRAKLAKKYRQTVILRSMESFSVENLQGLIICSFDTIGGGRGPSAWSIVGSMTRTVEQLQLSVEDEDQQRSMRETKTLIKRMAFLPPCRDWAELEERRRVFWNVFLMDRFCSIATGWNLCLTSADVKRRLPCEGALWERGVALRIPAPYFGVADQPSPHASAGGGDLPNPRSETEDPASLGGFAYCIEATESLSLITSFFLQQAVNVSNVHDVQRWLMRFKQLDLRLIQWKIYLPEQWQEACVLNADGNMDPNLTLAHITHNTAVVLLHQGVAYPSREWQTLPIRLPSGSSSETCLAAASEVAIIADKFLQDMPRLLTNPQFAFCLFVCARLFLAHAAYYGLPLSQYFLGIVNSLWEISRRWNGRPRGARNHRNHNVPPAAGDDLASKFAARLVHARQHGHAGHLDLRQAAYSDDTHDGDDDDDGKMVVNGNGGGVGPSPGPSPSMTMHSGQLACGQPDFGNGNGNGNGGAAAEPGATPDSMTLAFPPLPLAFQVPGVHHQHQQQAGDGLPPPPPQPCLYDPGQAAAAPDNSNNPGAAAAAAAAAPLVMPAFQGQGAEAAFENLDSFLDYSLPPTQRISQFSQLGSHHE
ncbi:fungal-specific transcription factor domain-containing protein [Xylariomycetidae sp. FL0641]|nr:fungal-specific transcription factor domain-containing protein [Xylariomycetidae sp. FL0641]